MVLKDYFNFNIGIVGHVDSGKTTLSKALSTVASTNAFDKDPQSRERGITLDLGFSSFKLPVAGAVGDPKVKDYGEVLVTIVDCPGHASLLRTVIGGASIIDAFVLVIDIVKGVQQQTAECLIVAEITRPGRMIIALNKIDSIPEAERAKKIDVTIKRLRKTLQISSFADVPIVPVSAGSEDPAQSRVGDLINVLAENVYYPSRSSSGDFLFSVDHCFTIRGQGSVMTGTVIQGGLGVGDTVEIPFLAECKKVKSIQQFKQPLQKIAQGDRAGICVGQFPNSQFDRSLVCSPGSLPLTYGALVSVSRIAFYKSTVPSRAKMHISLGHETTMARCSFFSVPKNNDVMTHHVTDVMDRVSLCDVMSGGDSTSTSRSRLPYVNERGEFVWDRDYEWMGQLVPYCELEKLPGGAGSEQQKQLKVDAPGIVCLLEFDQPVLSPRRVVYIASKLDTDIHVNTCRIAFAGNLVHSFTDRAYQTAELPKLKVFKRKSKTGVVERMTDDYTVIVQSIFKKETNLDLFSGLKVGLSTGERGVIEGGFGQSGKVKIRVSDGLLESTRVMLEAMAISKKKKKGAKEGAGEASQPSTEEKQQDRKSVISVQLDFKRYVFDTGKKLVQ